MGTRELAGLMILSAMLNNWDLDGTRNTAVLRVRRPDGQVEHRYVIADLGATFGRTGRRPGEWSKWSAADFEAQAFIDGVDEHELDLHYEGLGKIDKVPLAHAQWFSRLLDQLSNDQIRRAFEAAGAGADDTSRMTARIRGKVSELSRACRGQWPPK